MIKKIIISILYMLCLACIFTLALFAAVNLINHIINNPNQDILLPILGIVSSSIIALIAISLFVAILFDLLTSSRYESKEKEFECTKSTDKEGSIICDISGKSTEKNKSIDFNNETINAINLNTDIEKLEIKNIKNLTKIDIGKIFSGPHINNIEELTIDNIDAKDGIIVYLLDNKSKNFTLNISNIILNNNNKLLLNDSKKIENFDLNISNIKTKEGDKRRTIILSNQSINNLKLDEISNLDINFLHPFSKNNIKKIENLKISNINKSLIFLNNLDIEKLEISNFNTNGSMILMNNNVKIDNLKINHNNNEYIIKNFSYNDKNDKKDKLIKFKYLENEIEFNEKEYCDSNKLKLISIYDIIIHKLESLTSPPTDLSQSSLSSSQTEKT